MEPLAKKQAAPPGVFTFLKQGVVLPARSYGLFLCVFALNVVLGISLLAIKLLVVAPLVKPLNCGNSDISALTQGITRGHAWALLAGVAYLALYAAAWLVLKVATISATAVACSGEEHRRTFASLLRDAARGATLARAAAAYACGLVMLAPCAAAVLLLAAVPAGLLLDHSYPPWLVKLGMLPPLIGYIFTLYLDVVGDMAVVVSVVEKKKDGHAASRAAAVARAWRLMRGTTARALLFAAVRKALHAAVGPASAHAVGWWCVSCDDDVAFVVGGVLAYVLHRAVRMFSVVALVAYYFECRKSKEIQDKAGHVD